MNDLIHSSRQNLIWRQAHPPLSIRKLPWFLFAGPLAVFVDFLISQQQFGGAIVSGQGHIPIGSMDRRVARSANATSPFQQSLDGHLVAIGNGERLQKMRETGAQDESSSVDIMFGQGVGSTVQASQNPGPGGSWNEMMVGKFYEALA